MKTEKFDITGMGCAACAAHIEKELKKQDGVHSVQVNLLSNSMTASFDENVLDARGIEQAVSQAGYKACLRAEKKQDEYNISQSNIKQQKLKKRWRISLVLLIPLLYLAMGPMVGLPLPAFILPTSNPLSFAGLQLLLTLIIVIVNRSYFDRGFAAMLRLSPNMDTLVALGTSAAITYSLVVVVRMALAWLESDSATTAHLLHKLYFESGATILTLVTLGKYLESRSKQQTSGAITKLMSLTPQTAIVLRDGIQIESAIDDLCVGDLLLVKQGERIPVDGIVSEGEASVDESALTGESIFVFKRPGDRLLSGSINQSGLLIFRATAVGQDSTLSQIIRLVENTSSSKAAIAKTADKVSAIFVPTVVVLALATLFIWLANGEAFSMALERAIAVLIISCPCALGLATPVAIMAGTGRAAELGILVKTPDFFELARKINSVALDKTGTITQGQAQISGSYTEDENSEEEILQIAAALESLSNHPLAKAVREAAEQRGLTLPEVSDFETQPGLGLTGKIRGESYAVGNQQLLSKQGIYLSEACSSSAQQAAKQGKTPLFVAQGNRAIGFLVLADSIKTGSREAIKQFVDMGCEPLMLTGDRKETAEAIRKQAGIERVFAEVLPQDKDKEIARLQNEGRCVAMVGDGINDAPALARADVGIAIGSGTDIAIETADVILMRNDLRDAAKALRLGRATLNIIRQNLFWAFFYNLLGIPLAAGMFYPIFGWQLSPMFAAAAMSLSSVTVVSNALRLTKFK